VPGCLPGQLRVRADAGQNDVVSEGQGYGLLLTVLMAWHDPQARARFDALYAYVQAHPSALSPALMAWAQDEDCRTPSGEADSATDGDLDIAYALLLAARQWGAGGPVKYRQEALRRIQAIRVHNLNPDTGLTNLGDWASSLRAPGGRDARATRTSDWMPGHLRAFGRASGDPAWTHALAAHLRAVAQLAHPVTGLLPDFALAGPDGHLSPAPPHFLEGEHDGQYSWNACRDPWRLATDAVVSGDPGLRTVLARISGWARQASGGDPARLREGYRLDGTPLATGFSLAYAAPLLPAAMLGGDQRWLDRLWQTVTTTAPEGYYPDSIALLSALVAGGRWVGL
jgi:endoglucanase